MAGATRSSGSPLIGGVACFAPFVVHEARARHPMLDLVAVPDPQLRGRQPDHPRRLRRADRRPLLPRPLPPAGRRLLAAGGGPGDDADLADPLRPLAALGQARVGNRAAAADDRRARSSAGSACWLLLRVGADAGYVSDVLPAILVFGLGLSATVAPLTATVLDSVDERHVGIASGVNNGVSRVAGLLAIAVLGAVISARFGTTLDSEPRRPAAGAGGGTDGRRRQETAAGCADDGAAAAARGARVRAAAADASTSAFHLGVLIAGLLMIAGGGVSGLGIVEPEAPLRGGAGRRRGHRGRVRPRRRLRLRLKAGPWRWPGEARPRRAGLIAASDFDPLLAWSKRRAGALK